MSEVLPERSRMLPERPNLRSLEEEAWCLLDSGEAENPEQAQLQTARLYGFASWERLKSFVDSLEEAGKLKHAIDTNDFVGVRTLMTRNPALHKAPMGYGRCGPLTWVAECRVPLEPPSTTRLAIAQWMIDQGSDVHQGGDAPLMRAALSDDRIEMMKLLVGNGADVNAEWSGTFPILYAACETVAPKALLWLLEHGADPNLPLAKGRESALDYLMGTYVRSEQMGRCVDLLLRAGSGTRRNLAPAALEILRGRLDKLAGCLDADPELVHRRFAEFDFGATAGRRMNLRGGTLLHLAAEFGSVTAAWLLLDRGADVNARAALDESGRGGQTPIFHAVSQFEDSSWLVAKLLAARGADLAVRATLPGHYERPDEWVNCTPLGYARRFPGGESATLRFLEEAGAAE